MIHIELSQSGANKKPRDPQAKLTVVELNAMIRERIQAKFRGKLFSAKVERNRAEALKTKLISKLSSIG
jgi:hypothetical protein